MENLTHDERQAVLLALAKLAVERPGWHWYLSRIAEKMNGVPLFEELLTLWKT